jgi:GH15 family glucan-1,4-alpha-glucosidase
MPNLIDSSIDVIRAGQSANGAYVASPTFSQYGYSWLRDGAWIAHGMDSAGQHDSARAFYRWGAATLAGHAERVDALLAKLARGEAIAESDYLPTRFTLDGGLGQEDWPDFQLDGYGAWLWGLVQHVRRHNDDALWRACIPAVTLTVRYLNALWQSPNYDCWEEHRQHIHPATLAALYGGLTAVAEMDAALVPSGLPAAIRDYTLAHGVTADGHFMKYLGNDAVDSSLLWLAVPYRLVEVDDPRFLATVAKIERDILRPGGGVYRYAADTYFGGGEWLLLTAWLAWTYLELGRADDARRLMTWIEAQATPQGPMPEQVCEHTLAPAYYPEWVEKWGTPALPLLWSHGMYLILNTLTR